MQTGIQRQSSLKEKLKSSINCCFSGTAHHDPLDGGELCYDKLNVHRAPRSPTTPPITPPRLSWFKKSPLSSEYEGEADQPPRTRGRSLRSRMSRRLHHHHHYHRQSQSADFSYDPSSYALNFENESPEEEYPYRNFCSRLPASPPRKFSDELAAVSTAPKEIVGFS